MCERNYTRSPVNKTASGSQFPFKCNYKVVVYGHCLQFQRLCPAEYQHCRHHHYPVAMTRTLLQYFNKFVIMKYRGASKFERRDVMIFRGTLCRTYQTTPRLQQGAGLFCTQQETSKRRQTSGTINAGSNDIVCRTRLLFDDDLKELLKQRRGTYSSEFSQRVLLPMML